MLSKQERFQEWRGNKAEKENKYFNTAESISEYISSKEDLKEIYSDLDAPSSKTFKSFDEFSGRSLGTVAFLKLVIDEVLEKLGEQKPKLSEPLIKMKPILESFYDSVQNISETELDRLIKIMNELFDLEDSEFADKALAKKIFFSIYTTLRIIELTRSSLNKFKKALVSGIISLDKVALTVESLLKKIESKAQILSSVQVPDPEVENEDTASKPFDILQTHFNKRYLNMLHEQDTEEPIADPAITLKQQDSDKNIQGLRIIKKLNQLEEEMEHVSAHIIRLIKLRKSTSELAITIKSVDRLLQATKKNDLKSTDRKYFLELISEHASDYNVLVEHANSEKKELFLTKVKQLSTAVEQHNLSITVTHGLTWISTPLAPMYRSYTPQWAQNTIESYMPATQDSECKHDLKELAESCLTDLRNKSIAQHQQIDEINGQLFKGDDSLKKLIMEAPFETLLNLHQATTVAQKATHAYCRILLSIKTNLDTAYIYKQNSKTLEQFIKLNDGFWVALSNFFAKFLWIFKSDTAKMIDEATECKRKIELLGAKYHAAGMMEVQQINNDPNVDQEVKYKLQADFFMEVNQTNVRRINYSSAQTRPVRLLIKSLSELFKENPEPHIEKYASDELESETQQLKL